ncbi:MAG: hypothetical protein ACTSRL_21200, partial [Candidatus Helarchaeota archaeon]
FAGILGLIGAGLFLLGAFINWFLNLGTGMSFTTILTFIVAIVAFICAILVLVDKTFGCVVLLLLGIFMLIQPILIDTGIITELYITTYSYIAATLILLSGLIGTAVGSE